MKIIGAYIGIFLIAALLSFFITAGLVKLVCWAFGFVFTWKLVVGVWAILALLGGIFKSSLK